MKKETKEKEPKVPTFQWRLDGSGTKYMDELCAHCRSAYAVRSWDTVFGSETMHFCNGKCLWLFIHARQASRQA